MKLLFFLILISFSNSFAAQVPVIKDVYFNLFSGHLHQGPNPQSTSLKVLNCGDRFKVITNEKEGATPTKFSWIKLQTASYIGYVRKEFLSDEPPKCYSDKYLKFVEQFKLEVTDKYNWGRLYDQYVLGKSRVK